MTWTEHGLQEPKLTENARSIFDLRYSRKSEDGKPTETPAEAIKRVAENVASVTALYVPVDDERALKQDSIEGSIDMEKFPYRTAKRQYEYLGLAQSGFTFEELMHRGTPHIWEQADKYAEMITNLDFLPNSPTWTGAGTPLGQLAACFVIPVADDLVTRRDSIFTSLQVASAIQQTGGGNGFSFGNLRPEGATVKRSMGKASGPLGFARMYNGAFKEVAQGGTRRGANMLVLPVEHPDIRKFIKAKVVEGDLDQFNISVAISDEFMEAVEKDDDFDLVHAGKIYETVKARELYDEIIENAWVIGDPGNLFIDRANRDNPMPMRYRLEATNPCGEQWLGPYENCCLGSINLANFADWDGGFDWERFAKIVVLATEFLDDVVDANQYVATVPELEKAAQGGRRIGLGLMGLADVMLKLGIRYGSDKGLDFASQVTEYARYMSMLTSIRRARERGAFDWIEDSIYDPQLLGEYGIGGTAIIPEGPDGIDYREVTLWAPPTSLVPNSYEFGRPSIDWSALSALLKEHGIRNSAQFTFAPTGTISNVAGIEGSGCEPLFALSYTRTVMQDGQDIKLHYASPLFQQALEKAGISFEQIAKIVEAVAGNGGSCQGLSVAIPDSILDIFVVAADVTPEEHVWTQAALQAFVDNSISKTINLPNSATVEDVGKAYKLAYELGCKGITVYRQGSRQLEVLSTGEKKAQDDWPVIHPKPIPFYAADQGLAGRVFPVETAFGKVQVTITEIEGHPGRPFDVRLQIGKGGNDKNADVEAIGRMISLAFRSGVAVSSVVDQLEGIGGATITGFGERRVRSVADAVAKLLSKQYLSFEVEVNQVIMDHALKEKTGADLLMVADASRVCPNCLNASLVMEAGCRHCEVKLGGCGEYSGCD